MLPCCHVAKYQFVVDSEAQIAQAVAKVPTVNCDVHDATHQKLAW